jgi:hypothetical protein
MRDGLSGVVALRRPEQDRREGRDGAGERPRSLSDAQRCQAREPGGVRVGRGRPDAQPEARAAEQDHHPEGDQRSEDEQGGVRRDDDERTDGEGGKPGRIGVRGAEGGIGVDGQRDADEELGQQEGEDHAHHPGLALEAAHHGGLGGRCDSRGADDAERERRPVRDAVL